MASFEKKDDVADAIILAKYWAYKERGETWAGPDMSKMKEFQPKQPKAKSKKRAAPARKSKPVKKKRKK